MERSVGRGLHKSNSCSWIRTNQEFTREEEQDTLIWLRSRGAPMTWRSFFVFSSKRSRNRVIKWHVAGCWFGLQNGRKTEKIRENHPPHPGDKSKSKCHVLIVVCSLVDAVLTINRQHLSWSLKLIVSLKLWPKRSILVSPAQYVLCSNQYVTCFVGLWCSLPNGRHSELMLIDNNKRISIITVVISVRFCLHFQLGNVSSQIFSVQNPNFDGFIATQSFPSLRSNTANRQSKFPLNFSNNWKILYV